MRESRSLHDAFGKAAARFPDRTAIVEPGQGSIGYRELDLLSDRLRDRLVALGVRRGDRVGFWIQKSIDSIVAI